MVDKITPNSVLEAAREKRRQKDLDTVVFKAKQQIIADQYREKDAQRNQSKAAKKSEPEREKTNSPQVEVREQAVNSRPPSSEIDTGMDPTELDEALKNLSSNTFEAVPTELSTPEQEKALEVMISTLDDLGSDIEFDEAETLRAWHENKKLNEIFQIFDDFLHALQSDAFVAARKRDLDEILTMARDAERFCENERRAALQPAPAPAQKQNWLQKLFSNEQKPAVTVATPEYATTCENVRLRLVEVVDRLNTRLGNSKH